jgi:hypothetical protein
MKCGLDKSRSGKAPMAGCCKHDNEPSGSTNVTVFPAKLSGHVLSKTMRHGAGCDNE